MTQRDELALLLEVRASVYGLLATLYLAPPTPELLATVSAPAFVAEWPLGRGTPGVDSALASLAATLPGLALEPLRQEFFRLFGALGPAAAPPWQSVYLDRERVPFGEETERVRQLFAQYGLALTERGRHAEDHIGLELQFLARLSARAAERLAEGDEPGVQALLRGQRSCLEEHLLRWVDRFVRLVEEASGGGGFYAAMARLTLGCLRYDRDWLHQATRR